MPSDASERLQVFDGRLPPPRFAAIETTMFCNLRCPFCIQFQDGTTVRGPHMAPETFERIADELFPHIDGFQPSVSGEPLMTRGLERVLERARRNGLRVEYYTNATLLDRRMAARILPTAGRIHVSFDGATRATFEALRRGASFERVVDNVRGLLRAASLLPQAQRPPIGLACTLMEQNVRELPDLVDLAADLGVDFLECAHVVPGTDEMRDRSLHHHQELARECIERAFERARARGLPFVVQPLDNLIAAVADEDKGSPHARCGARQDGVQAGVPHGAVNVERMPGWPSVPPDGADPGLLAERARRGSTSAPPANGPAAALPEVVWTCHYLWERLYVDHAGNAAPCCVPGVPLLGNLLRQPLEEVWNGELQRAMRIGLVRREPAPCCRGCQHVEEVRDPARIRALLGGRLPPPPLEALPVALRPVTGASAPVAAADSEPIPAASPPVLSWPGRPGAEGYEVQVSADAFRTLLFTTRWHGIELSEPCVRIPEWAWRAAPAGRTLHWRALAVLSDERRVVASGAFTKELSTTPA